MARHGPLTLTRIKKDELEARNGRLQFKRIVFLFGQSTHAPTITSDIIKDLHHAAIKDIYTYAGEYRNIRVKIDGSSHKPPEPKFILGLIEEMCNTVNNNVDWSPISTAAYLLWRVNWIHPFRGGNGRTSRAVAYLAMCIRLNFILYGKPTLPELIVRERAAYRAALQDADEAQSLYSTTDVTQMESLLDRLLQEQLSRPEDP